MVGDGLNSPRQQGGKLANKDAQTLNPYPDKYSMRNTRVLRITKGLVRQVPVELLETARQESVNVVNFENNLLTEVPTGLPFLSELLTDLNLSKNQLCNIPTYISQFSRLSHMNISCNLLRELPMEFGGLQTLSHLDISHNRFNSLPFCIYELKCLESLVANDNHINSFDVSEKGLGGLRKLNSLNLSNNDIYLVPPQLGNLTNIRHLELEGNPFRQPRHQILVLGTDEIMSYLRGRIPTSNE